MPRLDAERAARAPEGAGLRKAAKGAASALMLTVTNVPENGRPHWCRNNDGSHDATCKGMLHTQDALRAALSGSSSTAPLDVLETAYRFALKQIEADGETINRLTTALRVATHSPHDQTGEPNEGFPVCSVCGAIQTEPSGSTAPLDVERLIEARHKFERHPGPADHPRCRRWAEEVIEVLAAASPDPAQGGE
jgi:hypothetical protein